MTYSVLIFAYRKPGTTPEQFRAHYEGKHVPLVKEIGGEYVPAPFLKRHFFSEALATRMKCIR